MDFWISMPSTGLQLLFSNRPSSVAPISRPLHYAAQLRPKDGAHLCAALLQAEAELDATTRRGHTALLFAAGRGHGEVLCISMMCGNFFLGGGNWESIKKGLKSKPNNLRWCVRSKSKNQKAAIGANVSLLRPKRSRWCASSWVLGPTLGL